MTYYAILCIIRSYVWYIYAYMYTYGYVSVAIWLKRCLAAISRANAHVEGVDPPSVSLASKPPIAKNAGCPA